MHSGLLGLAQHLGSRECDEQAEHQRQCLAIELLADPRTDNRTGQHARHQLQHQRPAYRPHLVVSAHRRQRGEHDGRQRRRNGHVDDDVRCEVLRRKYHRYERHQHHAAADTQQASGETAGATHQQQRENQSSRHLMIGASVARPITTLTISTAASNSTATSLSLRWCERA